MGYIKLILQTSVLNPNHSWSSCRGSQIFSFTSHSKKENISKLKELSDNIAQLDAQHATSPTHELYQKRIRLQTEFDLASTAKAEHLLLRTRRTVYKFGDKVDRLLAHQARQSYMSCQITQIQTTSGSTVTDHKQINDTFAEYYGKLYRCAPLAPVKQTLFIRN